MTWIYRYYYLTAGLLVTKSLILVPTKQWESSPWLHQKQDGIVIGSAAETGGLCPYFGAFSLCRWQNCIYCNKTSHLCTLADCWQNSCVSSETRGQDWIRAFWGGLKICVFPQTQYCQYFFSSCIFLLIYQLEKDTYVCIFFISQDFVHFFSADMLIPLLRDICW